MKLKSCLPNHLFAIKVPALVRFLTVVSFVSICMSYQGCVEKNMTLKEAKEVTVSMSGRSFTPPPRRVSDILAVLEDAGTADPETIRQLNEKINATPPVRAGKRELMKFHFRRGEAAANLGLYSKALADMRMAYQLMEESGSYDWNIERTAGTIERLVGNYQQAIQILEKHTHRKDANGLAFWQLINVYSKIGDFQAVEDVRKRGKSTIYRRGRQDSLGGKLHLAEIEYHYLMAQGKYREAEPFIRKALRLSNQVRNQYPRVPIYDRMRLSQNLMAQKRFIEAEIEARNSIKEALALSGKDSALTAWGLETLGQVLMKQGRVNDARRVIAKSIQINEDTGISDDSYFQGILRITLGISISGGGDFQGALEEFLRAKEGLKTNRFLYTRHFERDPHVILTYLMTGQLTEALKFSHNAYQLLEAHLGEANYQAAEMKALRGMAFAGQQQFERAYNDFSSAVPVLLSGGQGHLDFLGKQRHRCILEAYLDLLNRIYRQPTNADIARKAPEEAFKMAEALNESLVKKALGASGARAAANDPVLGDLVRKEQDAQEQIEVLEKTVVTVLAMSTDQQNPAMLADLRSAIGKLRQARSSLLDEIKTRFPKYADFIDPPPITSAVVQKHLRHKEAMLVIFPARTRTYTWVIPKEGRILFSAAPMGKEKLLMTVTRLREALAPNPTMLGDIPEFNLSLAHELYTRLIRPVAKGFKGAESLVVVASGPIGQLPLAVLPTANIKLQHTGELFAGYRDVPWLIRKASLTRLPSVSSFVTLRVLPEVDLQRKSFAGFGDPFFNLEQMESAEKDRNQDATLLANRGGRIHVRGIRVSESGNLDEEKIPSSALGQLNRLPDTADEIKSIARAVGADLTEDVFLGRHASERRVKAADLKDRKIIAFASHGLVPGDLDGLSQPAIALSAPAVTGDNEDGLLTMDEILNLQLNADWVVLSACNTGAAEGAGAEAVSGLGRAFFYAGTRALLVSMWPVETASAKKLTTSLFDLQQKNPTLSRARALQNSMLDLIDHQQLKDGSSGKTIASYAHPLFWAPFIVVGDGG